MKELTLDGFIDGEGRLLALPKRATKRKLALEYLAAKFEPGTDYAERQVNDIIDRWHAFGDLFLLRREMIEAGVMNRTRDGARYWRAPDGDPANGESPESP